MSDPSPQSKALSDDLSLAGQKLGDYQLLRCIGRGAMAEVYLAEQQTLKRQVAIKILLPSLATEDTYVQRFQREAHAVAALTHANIVQIYEVGHVDDIHYIAQEYVPGQNLKQLISKTGGVDIKLAYGVLRQVAAALHKAGEQGIVHRDIKPENILITSTGEVKVADFGLARVISQNGEGLNLTQVGITMGTPLYMSPEQAEGKTLDGRSDIYSLGVTIYHLLAGKPPFDGDNPLAVAVQHLKTEPARIEDTRRDIPPALARIVHKMLMKQPENRYQNASELMNDLRDFQKKSGSELLGVDWSDWSMPELAALDDNRVEGTRELAKLMKLSASSVYRNTSKLHKWVLITLGVFACFMVGAAFAWIQKDPPLLQPGPNQVAVETPRRKTAERQWLYAMQVNADTDNHSPEVFQSVAKYHPKDEEADNLIWILRAQAQEAFIYLDQKQYIKAHRLFRTLSDQEAVQIEARAIGLAGQSIALFQMGKIEEAEALAQLVLDDKQLLEVINENQKLSEMFDKVILDP
ncbi:MAG: hypothetical protein COA78_37775 [Blastopirellula sp.]|nr:MAG: hypothetical protein COA78_37775 [Blastopirellula sp.]